MRMDKDQIASFDFYFVEFEKILNHLNATSINSNDLFEKRIAIFHIFKSIMKNLKFLRKNYEESPFATFAALSRMVVDHYSGFFLLTSYSSKDEQKLRYYLFMIGSLEGRAKTMSEFESSVSSHLPPETILGNKKAIKHDLNAVQKFIEKIETENLKNVTNEKHIKNRNWKFPSEVQAVNNHFYKWQELYEIAKIPNHFAKAIQQHFSEFTHGLGLTILYTEGKLDSKISIIAILSIIQSLIGKIILKEFSEELKDVSLNPNFIYQCNYNWENWH